MFKFDFQYILSKKKRGKKLVRGGVKNFCISKFEYSTFFCTKNHCHISKSRENRSQMKFNHSEVQMKSNAYFENFSFHFLLILRMAEFHLYLFSRVFETSQLSFAPRAIACHILKTHEISYSGGIYLKLFAQKHFLLLPFSCTTSTART